MWTPTTCAQHSRAGLRYGRDLADAEWLILSLLLPPPSDCIEVVRKADNQVGFAVIARRWVVERFFAWINRNR